MNSSLKGNIPLYLGVDLTDRYSAICRAIDVCGLMPSENGELKSYFWFWQWDAAPGTLDVTEVINELTGTRAAMLDGPHKALPLKVKPFVLVKGWPLLSARPQT